MTAPVPTIVGAAQPGETPEPTPDPPPSLGGPRLLPAIAFSAGRNDPAPVFEPIGGDGTPRMSFTSKRGRDGLESVDIAPGDLSLTADNSDGALTPGRNPDVDADKPIKVDVLPPPYDNSYAVYRGFTDTIKCDPASGQDDVSTVTLSAFDGFDGLTRIKLLSDFAGEVLALDPWAFYPLSESDEATAPVGDISGNNRPTLPIKNFRAGGFPDGTYKFGAAPLCPSDAATSLEITSSTSTVDGHISNGSGWALQLPTDVTGGIQLSLAAGFTILMGFETTVNIGGAALALLNGNDRFGNRIFDVYMAGDGLIVGDLAGDPSFVTSRSYNDGKSHLLGMNMEAGGKKLRVYIDGQLVGAVTASVGSTAIVDGKIGVGVFVGDNIVDGSDPWSGRLGYIIPVTRPLPAATHAHLYQAWLGFPGETAGQRLTRYLSYANWRNGEVFDQGLTLLGLAQVAGKTVLEACTDVAKSEQGLFFIRADGAACFHSRHHRINRPSRVTFGADDTMPFNPDGLVFNVDPSLIRNSGTGTRPGGATQRAIDQASIDRHGEHTFTLDPAVLTDNEVLDALFWEIVQNGSTKVRVGTITIDPYNFPALWPWALGLEISDRITLDQLGLRAPADTMDFFIEQVGHNATETSWLTTYALSLADTSTFWQLDDPRYSVLDVSTVLAR